MGSTPQWTYIVAPGATLIAFTLGVLVTWWTDRRRWRREDEIRALTQQREDSTRYHEDKLETYAKFLGQCTTMAVLEGIRARRRDKAGTADARWNELVDQAQDRTMEAAQTMHKATLLAGAELRANIEDLWSAALATHEHGYAKYDEIQARVKEAIRKELGTGLPGTEAPRHRT
jgi:hypothetical protein